MLKILSLGAGVQSTTLLLMSIRGELPRLDAAIFADTGWEPQAVYDHLAWLTNEAERAGIPVYQVNNGDIRADSVTGKAGNARKKGERWASMPLFVSGQDVHGMIRRQCTAEYKIVPIQRKIRELTGLKPRQRVPKGVILAEQWIGISIDEAQRAKASGLAWLDHQHPLIDPLKFSRADCQAWLDRHYPCQPVPKSACIGCLFRDDRSWAAMKRDQPNEWADACQFDDLIRQATDLRGQAYLHSARIPLREVQLNEDQQDMFGFGCGVCDT